MNRQDVMQLVVALIEDNDAAYHTLIEAPHDVVPILVTCFAGLPNGVDRATVVEVIWQHRLQSTIPFLAAILDDPHPEVWKQALDGLVAIGGAEALAALWTWRSGIQIDDERLAWVDEAIEQLQSP